VTDLVPRPPVNLKQLFKHRIMHDIVQSFRSMWKGRGGYTENLKGVEREIHSAMGIVYRIKRPLAMPGEYVFLTRRPRCVVVPPRIQVVDLRGAQTAGLRTFDWRRGYCLSLRSRESQHHYLLVGRSNLAEKAGHSEAVGE
jgi:hypothetical protein